MTTAIGVVMTSHIVAGRLQDQRLKDAPLRYPREAEQIDALSAMPSTDLVELIADQVQALTPEATSLDASGVAVPGIVRHGVVEDSPNLPQIKGMLLAIAVAQAL